MSTGQEDEGRRREIISSAPFTSNRIISESQLSLMKVCKTIPCKILTAEAGVGGDPQLSIKVALHKIKPPLLDIIDFRKFK